MQYVLLILGFVLLIKGADLFVDGSSSTAKRLRVSSLIIGLTVVAMGTSLPECAVSVSASLAGKNELAIANVVGSNLFNLMAICGLCALFCPLAISKETLRSEFPFSIVIAAVLLGLGAWGSAVGRLDGIVLLLLFVSFLAYVILSALKNRGEEEEYKLLPVWKCVVFIIGGAAAIAVGGRLVVSAASAIAKDFGMSDNLIGLTIVALGTSLPELVTSIVAARKNEMEMALGNVIGSNIFNILFVLGTAATISPVSFNGENAVDLVVLIGLSLMVLAFCIPKKQLVRWHGVVMLLAYAGYTVYIFNR